MEVTRPLLLRLFYDVKWPITPNKFAGSVLTYLIAILFYRLTGTASSEDAAEWETLLTKGNADESVGSNKDLITGE